MNGDRALSREGRFTARLLLAAGAAVAAITVGVDLLKGSFEFGRIQAAGLGLGVCLILFGVALLRSSLVRRIVVRLWPFGAEEPARPSDLVAFALWLAVVSGILEVALRYVQFESGQRWGTLNPHSIWMVPLVNAVTLMLLAGALALFSWRGLRYLGSPRLAGFVFLLLAIGAPLSLYSTELRWISVGLLTLGLAFQGSRWIVARQGGTRGWARRSAIPIAAVIAVVAVAPFARQSWSERSALASMPEAPAGAPNVLLIILDTVRAQNMSLHGYVRKTTPRLEELAVRSTVYDQVYAPSSWTLPSHGSFFTGRPPHQQSGNSFTPLDDALPTLAEVLGAHGYYSFAIVANSDNAYPHTGLDRGFLRYDAGTAATWEVLQASRVGAVWRWGLRRFGIYLPTRKEADIVNERFLASLDRRGDRPFFAFLNYYDAHYTFDRPLPPATLIEGWEGSSAPIVGLMDPGMGRVVDEYDREIAFLDDRLGSLFATLGNRGILDGTIVIVSSDHGEEFMEHGHMGHGFNVYNTTLLVPLLISFPGVAPEGVRVSSPVTIQNLPVTITELAGISGPFHGTSLLAFAEDSTPPATPVLSEVSVVQSGEDTPGPWNFRSLNWGGLHYIHNPNDSEEIYDVVQDPWETTNLIATGRDLPLAELRAALSSLIEVDPPAMTATERATRLATGRDLPGDRLLP
jgi:arylsulfatase A-like enzyme